MSKTALSLSNWEGLVLLYPSRIHDTNTTVHDAIMRHHLVYKRHHVCFTSNTPRTTPYAPPAEERRDGGTEKPRGRGARPATGGRTARSIRPRRGPRGRSRPCARSSLPLTRSPPIPEESSFSRAGSSINAGRNSAARAGPWKSMMERQKGPDT